MIVYTSGQGDTSLYDGEWLANYGVEVIRDKAKVLLPSLRVGRAVRKIVTEREIKKVFFGAAAPLGLLSQGLRRATTRQFRAPRACVTGGWARMPR